MTRGFEVAPEKLSPPGVNTVLKQRNPSRVICLIEFVRMPVLVGAHAEMCCLTSLSTLIPVPLIQQLLQYALFPVQCNAL